MAIHNKQPFRSVVYVSQRVAFERRTIMESAIRKAIEESNLADEVKADLLYPKRKI